MTKKAPKAKSKKRTHSISSKDLTGNRTVGTGPAHTTTPSTAITPNLKEIKKRILVGSALKEAQPDTKPPATSETLPTEQTVAKPKKAPKTNTATATTTTRTTTSSGKAKRSAKCNRKKAAYTTAAARLEHQFYEIARRKAKAAVALLARAHASASRCGGSGEEGTATGSDTPRAFAFAVTTEASRARRTSKAASRATTTAAATDTASVLDRKKSEEHPLSFLQLWRHCMPCATEASTPPPPPPLQQQQHILRRSQRTSGQPSSWPATLREMNCRLRRVFLSTYRDGSSTYARRALCGNDVTANGVAAAAAAGVVFSEEMNDFLSNSTAFASSNDEYDDIITQDQHGGGVTAAAAAAAARMLLSPSCIFDFLP